MNGYFVQLIVGTRPEAIKLAHALAAAGVAPIHILTGQHPALVAGYYGLAGLPCHDLDCAGLDDPMAYARRVAAALPPLLYRDQPDLVIVQGDTSSASGGAQAAIAAGIPLAHVEAGLRSHDRAMPWPEEGNRIAIDEVADLLFAPTRGAATNLLHERVNGKVHLTGNTGIDALHATLATLATLPTPKRRAASKGEPLDLLVTDHRSENWGAGFHALAMALIQLGAEGSATMEVVIHPNPRVAETMRVLLDGQPGIRLAFSTSHAAMIARMRRADLVLSDSGGVRRKHPRLASRCLFCATRPSGPRLLHAAMRDSSGSTLRASLPPSASSTATASRLPRWPSRRCHSATAAKHHALPG